MERFDNFETASVFQFQIHYGKGRRPLFGDGNALTHRFGEQHLEPARLHGAREALPERTIIIDDQKRFVVGKHGTIRTHLPRSSAASCRATYRATSNLATRDYSELKLAARGSFAIDGAPRPSCAYDSAAFPPIARGERASGLFDQGLGDEEPQPHPLLLAVLPHSRLFQGGPPRPRGDIRLADLLEDLGCKTRTIVHHLDQQGFV